MIDPRRGAEHARNLVFLGKRQGFDGHRFGFFRVEGSSIGTPAIFA